MIATIQTLSTTAAVRNPSCRTHTCLSPSCSGWLDAGRCVPCLACIDPLVQRLPMEGKFSSTFCEMII
uniref:Uncharacterized protein n=1 Tax=Arundo donax TaxID=35708 RepID=A0A0A8XV67_ARUDO